MDDRLRNKPTRGPVGLDGSVCFAASGDIQQSPVRMNSNVRMPMGMKDELAVGKTRFSISISGHSILTRLSMIVESDILTDGAKLLPGVTWYDYTKRATEARKAEADLGGKGLLDKESEDHAKRIKKNLKAMKACDVDIRIDSKRQSDTQEEVVVLVKGGKGQERISCSMIFPKEKTTKDDKKLFNEFMALAKQTAHKTIRAAVRLH